MAFSRTIIMLGCLSLGIALFAHSATGDASKPAPPACNAPLPDDDTVSSYRRIPAAEKDSRLIQAAEEGAVGEVRALLAAGADVGARGESGTTALHRAAAGDHVEVARCLLAGGAEVNARDMLQRTPLVHASNTPMVRLLTAAGADPNVREPFSGSTPLHMAVKSEDAEAIAALLEAGADKSLRDKHGRIPVNYAGTWQLIQLLTES